VSIELVSVKGNSVRVKFDVVLMDLLVVPHGKQKRIIKPRGVFFDDISKIAAIVIQWYEESLLRLPTVTEIVTESDRTHVPYSSRRNSCP
jgi:hypothetical protein